MKNRLEEPRCGLGRTRRPKQTTLPSLPGTRGSVVVGLDRPNDLNAELAKLGAQCLASYAQDSGGLDLIALGMFQNCGDNVTIEEEMHLIVDICRT
jgi:hypothetical protein